MSKHETALALIDEQIEKTEKDQAIAADKWQQAQAALERSAKELKLIDWDLDQLRESRALLIAAREATIKS